MKTKLYALLSLILILTACEKEVEFNAPDVEAASDVTLALSSDVYLTN